LGQDAFLRSIERASNTGPAMAVTPVNSALNNSHFPAHE
jgi:hypothetical protein